MPDTNTPSAYVVDRWMTVDGYYYQGDSILHVIYNLPIETSWANKLSNNNIGININGFNVPKSWIKLVSDPNNYVAAEVQWLGLTNTDIVDLQFNSYWTLDTPEGYHNQWFKSAPSNIYFLPGNSPSNTTNTANTTNTTNTNSNNSSSTNTTNTTTFLANETTTNSTSSADTGKLTVYFVWELVKFIKYYTRSWNFFFFAYFISSLVNFQGMTFMYYFLFFPNLYHYNRRYLVEALKAIDEQTGYQYISNVWFSLRYSTKVLSGSDPLLGLPAKPNTLSFYEFGYHLDFVDNEFEVLLQILMALCKLGLVRLLLLLPVKRIKRVCQRILRYWKEIILFEVIMLAPRLNVILGNFYRQSSLFVLSNWKEMVNLSLVHFCSFLCLFLLLTMSITRLKRKRQDEKRKHHLASK